MKTNILFASLILMLSSYEVYGAATATEAVPAAAAAPQAVAGGPQNPAPTAEEIAAQKKAAGASAVNSVFGEGWSGFLPPAALTGIGGLSLTFGQQQNAAAASISRGTGIVANDAINKVGQIVQYAVPVAEEVAGRLYESVAPTVQASAKLILDQAAESAVSLADSAANTFVSLFPREKTPLEKLRDTVCTVPVCGASLAVLVATFAAWYVNSQPTPVQI